MKYFSPPHSTSNFPVARAFLLLAFSYLLFGLLLGCIGSFQYLWPSFLKNKLSFQQSRPLHVYLVISWIFTSAQGAIYYFLPRVTGRNLFWPGGLKIHFILQLSVSLLIIGAFFSGHFGGREYLEFPPWLGILLLLSWLPFAINFFCTLKPDYRKAPVYIWSWSTGIFFFFITVSESYLWLFDHFNKQIIRDITIQWKALGSMVGSWNMLVYGAAMFIMEKITNDKRISHNRISFAFYFLGLTNLLFNWGHHTYIVPAAPWVQTVAYVISMTELLLLGHIIWKWKKSLTATKNKYGNISYRFLSVADGWIFLNLTLAILISVPSLNYYTHGTHITVAHAMGATIGINTMLLFAVIFYVLGDARPLLLQRKERLINRSLTLTNIALYLFWFALLGSGLVKIAGKLNNNSFYKIMDQSLPWFRGFAASGLLLLAGIVALVSTAVAVLLHSRKNETGRKFNKREVKRSGRHLI